MRKPMDIMCGIASWFMQFINVIFLVKPRFKSKKEFELICSICLIIRNICSRSHLHLR